MQIISVKGVYMIPLSEEDNGRTRWLNLAAILQILDISTPNLPSCRIRFIDQSSLTLEGKMAKTLLDECKEMREE